MGTPLRLATLVAALATPAIAGAGPMDFSAGSWIIPMDVCYQPTKSFQDGSTITYAANAYASTTGSACPDTSGTARDGVLKAYGLVYRLLQNNIPVYYILNPSKTSVDDVDLTITSSGGTPVSMLSHTTGATTEFMNSTHTSISYRGAPFIISAADTAAALNVLKTAPTITGTDPRTGRTYFQDVYIHYAKTNILQAPVRATLLQTPPKIALLDIGGAAIGVLNGYLMDAGLYSSTAAKAYPSIGDVFTRFANVSDFTTSNGLVAGGFSILWAPHWEGTSGITTTDRDNIVQKISAFVDAGHPFLAQCAAVATLEGGSDPGNSSFNTPTGAYGHYMATATGSNHGLTINTLSQPKYPACPSAPYGRCSGDNVVVNPDTTIQAWIDPLTQTGDYPLDMNVQSWMGDFQPNHAGGYGYRPFVSSYVQSSSTTGPNNNIQIEAVAHKDGDPNKGLIIYLGGHSYGSSGSICMSSCSTFAQFNMIGLERLILNSLLFMGQVQQTAEQTRSAPIVYAGSPTSLDGKTFLGSYVQQTSASAAFPPWQGHFREYPAGGLAGTNVTAFNAVTADWDAADHIKTQAAADARNIYTAVNVNGKLTQIAFTTANWATISTRSGCSGASFTSANLTAIRTGVLGGVDHSIPAIIGPTTAGSSSRPVVAYVGALDGMIHAILVSGTVGSKTAGDELWAFIPPSQLCKVFQQSAGVDGSPNVGDAFVDTSGSGQKSWRTLLAIPDGTYAGGTLDVLDVTDPTGGSSTAPQPTFLWEASDSYTGSSGKTYVLGRAQGAAISPIITASGVRYAYFVVTDNTNGTAGNGWNMYALDAGSGSVVWRSNYTYTVDQVPPAPAAHNDVPGVAAVIDAAGDSGPVTNVYFADIEGKLWSVPAATGATQTRLYDAALAHGQSGSINFPVESGVGLYRDPTSQHLDILGVTGGADWVPSTTLSYVFKYDTQANSYADVATLGVGERVYALPTISGNQAYVITSVGQLQTAIGNAFSATGNLVRINLGATPGVTTLATVKQGAGEVAVDGSGNVIAASATGITQNSNGARDTSQAVVALQNATAKLLKVRAWLDWH